MVVLFIGLIAVMAAIGFKLIKSSGPYVQAVAAAKADARVVAALGSPMKEGLYFSGSVNEKSDWSLGSGGTTSGNADLRIAIHGPKGEGTIHVVGTMTGGKWVYSLLVVTIKDTGQTIDLNEKPKKGDLLENFKRNFPGSAALFTPQAA
jgi:hypothetical protein